MNNLKKDREFQIIYNSGRKSFGYYSLIFFKKNEENLTEIMVPDIDEFVKKIDFDNREIFIHLIEGMKEVKGQKLKQDDGIEEELEENEEK